MHASRHAAHTGEEWILFLERVFHADREFQRRLEPIQIAPMHARLVLFLNRRPDTGIPELAWALSVRSPLVMEAVQDLVGKRWITQEPAPGDRRATGFRLTEQGLQIVTLIHRQLRRLTVVRAPR